MNDQDNSRAVPPEMPLGVARAQDAVDLRPVPPEGGTPGPIRPPADDRFLHRTVPSRQRFAQAFLGGQAPGVQQSYAPGAKASDVEGWVEDDETVERLVRWREEAPYG